MSRILILVDLQNDFIDGVLGSDEAREIIPKVAKYIEENKDEYDNIYATRDTHREYDRVSVESERIPLHCVFGQPGHKINSMVFDAAPKDKLSVRDKCTFTAFNLPVTAYGKDVEIDICGLCTDICVVSTALYLRSGYPNAKITCLSDLCAGTTPENHEAALKVMRSCLIDTENAF